MLTAEERYRLLDEAAELSRRWEYGQVVLLLTNLNPDDLLVEPELGYLLAQALYREGEIRKASDLVRALRAPCRERGADRLYSRRLLLEGNLEVEFGQLEVARRTFMEVLSFAAATKDERLLAAATLNLGTVSWLLCKYGDALTGFSRATVAYDSLGDPYYLAACHHNLAMVYKEMGLLTEAESHFDISRLYYVEAGAEEEIAFTEYERALLQHLRGESQLALQSADRAFQKVAELGRTREMGEALRVLATIQHHTGAWEDARENLRTALGCALNSGRKLLEAEVLEELAMLSADTDQLDQASDFGQRAARCYEQMGSSTRAYRVLARLDTRRAKDAPNPLL